MNNIHKTDAAGYIEEKGLKGTALLDRAMDAYVTTELTDICYGTRGQYWNEFEIPAQGQNIIRCACIARAHYDDILHTSQMCILYENTGIEGMEQLCFLTLRII